MARTLAQRLAQIAIPLATAAVLSSCASGDLAGGFGKPLPTQETAQRPAPYDPFGASGGGTAKQVNKAETGATRPANEGQNTVAKTQMAMATPPANPRAPSPPLDGPGLSPFAGMSPEELRAQWGAPSLMRNEAGAQLWQFQGAGCVVLAYLYPNASGGMETAFAEALPGGDSASAVTGCLGKKSRPQEADAGRRARKPQLIVKPD